ncbi:MAG: AI-2E family transporter [Butyrivibrio sp.]|nr:AI-2E family transporter [Butyrivibrio sp.]
MKKYFSKLDQKYLKICIYAGLTVLITAGLGAVLLSTGVFWSKLWKIFTAVLKPMIIGGILSYLFLPIVTRIEKYINRKKEHKSARLVSVIFTYAIVILSIALVIFLIIVAVYKNVETLNVETIQNTFATIKNDYSEIWDFIESKLESYNIDTVNMTPVITAATEAVKNFFSGMLFGIIFSIYFMLDKSRIGVYWKRAFHLIFGQKSEDKLLVFMKDADNAFSGYIRGQFLDAFLVGVLSSIALSLVGVPSGVLVGIFVGIGNMVPYLGPIVGYATLVIVCLPTAAFTKMLIGFVVLAFIMFVDGNIINPKLLSENVDVHPLLVVAALIGGGAIGGVVGMLVAVPTAALLKLQFDRYLEKLETRRAEEDEEIDEV